MGTYFGRILTSSNPAFLEHENYDRTRLIVYPSVPLIQAVKGETDKK